MEPTGIVSANQDTASGPRSYLYMLHVARLIGFVENWDRIQMRSRNDNNNNDNDSNKNKLRRNTNQALKMDQGPSF